MDSEGITPCIAQVNTTRRPGFLAAMAEVHQQMEETDP
jgi:hypothetical protein